MTTPGSVPVLCVTFMVHVSGEISAEVDGPALAGLAFERLELDLDEAIAEIVGALGNAVARWEPVSAADVR